MTYAEKTEELEYLYTEMQGVCEELQDVCESIKEEKSDEIRRDVITQIRMKLAEMSKLLPVPVSEQRLLF